MLIKNKDSKALSRKQKKILKMLLAERRILKRFHGRTVEEMEHLNEKEQYILDFYGEDYIELMLKAIRAGLHIHPRIRGLLRKIFVDFIFTHRALGALRNYKLLRKTRGFEVGMRRSCNIDDCRLLSRYLELCRGISSGADDQESSHDNHSDDSQYNLETILKSLKQKRFYDPENILPVKEPQGLSQSEAYRILKKEGLVNCSRQAFLKYLHRRFPLISL